jgi:hypothetical protein
VKASPLNLVRAHYQTLVNFQTGKQRPQDHLVFEGLPIIALIASLAVGLEIPPGVGAGLLTVAGLLSAFLFQTLLQISQRSMEWADEEPYPGPDTSRRARFMREIAANAGYASLVCLLIAAMFVAVSVVDGTALLILSAVGIALAVHLTLVLSMVMSRVFEGTVERLDDARTGHQAKVARFPRRKAS